MIVFADRIRSRTQKGLEDVEPACEHPQRKGDEIAHEAFTGVSHPPDEVSVRLRRFRCHAETIPRSAGAESRSHSPSRAEHPSHRVGPREIRVTFGSEPRHNAELAQHPAAAPVSQKGATRSM